MTDLGKQVRQYAAAWQPAMKPRSGLSSSPMATAARLGLGGAAMCGLLQQISYILTSTRVTFDDGFRPGAGRNPDICGCRSCCSLAPQSVCPEGSKCAHHSRQLTGALWLSCRC